MRDTLFNKLKSYVIKNVRIDCEKDTYDVLNDSIVKQLNEEMKLLMEKNMFVYFMWNEDKKLIIKYSNEEDIKKSIYKKVIQIKTRLLISGVLALFATVVGKVNMSGCWCLTTRHIPRIQTTVTYHRPSTSTNHINGK